MGAAQALVDARRRFFWRLGRRIYMMARHDSVNRFATNGEREFQREVLSLLHRRSISPVIFDVGANVGAWTLALLAQAREMDGPHGAISIHAFEPFPPTFRTLSARLAEFTSQGLVRCVELALSSEDGEAQMFGTSGLETASLHGGVESTTQDRVTVKCQRADTYSRQNDIRDVHVLKCDAEGHDFEVIKGAEGLLAQGRVWFLQFEYNSRWIYSRHFLKDVFDAVANVDYALGKLTPWGIELYDSWHPELDRYFEGNYALIRKDLVKEIARRAVSVDAASTFA
jgi:FkbM family methyltransferase